MKGRSQGRYALISLGCSKNLIDSERMAGLLGLEGYVLVPRPEGADFVVINTCGFIQDARNESHQVIREMLELKRRRRIRGVIVTGCLAERDKEMLLETYPEIDQLVGVFGREEIATAVHRLPKEKGDRPHLCEAPSGPFRQMGPVPFFSTTAASCPGQERTLFRPVPERPLPDTGRLRLTLLKAFNLLPYTEHVETLARFERV